MLCRLEKGILSEKSFGCPPESNDMRCSHDLVTSPCGHGLPMPPRKTSEMCTSKLVRIAPSISLLKILIPFLMPVWTYIGTSPHLQILCTWIIHGLGLHPHMIPPEVRGEKLPYAADSPLSQWSSTFLKPQTSPVEIFFPPGTGKVTALPPVIQWETSPSPSGVQPHATREVQASLVESACSPAAKQPPGDTEGGLSGQSAAICSQKRHRPPWLVTG